MLALPAAMIRLLRPMERVFRESTWEYATVLLVGAILAPTKRTVTAALSVMGLLRQDAQFQTYHRVLNRATWSCLALSRILHPRNATTRSRGNATSRCCSGHAR